MCVPRHEWRRFERLSGELIAAMVRWRDGLPDVADLDAGARGRGLERLEESVERPSRVVLEAVDPDGNPVVLEGEELLGRAIQHELDHLNGVLFLDHLSPLKRKMAIKKWKKLQDDR